jgi:hypothetical protein
LRASFRPRERIIVGQATASSRATSDGTSPALLDPSGDGFGRREMMLPQQMEEGI